MYGKTRQKTLKGFTAVLFTSVIRGFEHSSLTKNPKNAYEDDNTCSIDRSFEMCMNLLIVGDHLSSDRSYITPVDS